MTDLTPAQAADELERLGLELSKHPDFRGKMFGPNSGVEVTYKLAVYFATHPLVGLPERAGKEQGE